MVAEYSSTGQGSAGRGDGPRHIKGGDYRCSEGYDSMESGFAAKLAAADVRNLDGDNDGLVDLEEYVAAGGTREEFDQFDTNKDGVLDASERKNPHLTNTWVRKHDATPLWEVSIQNGRLDFSRGVSRWGSSKCLGQKEASRWARGQGAPAAPAFMALSRPATEHEAPQPSWLRRAAEMDANRAKQREGLPKPRQYLASARKSMTDITRFAVEAQATASNYDYMRQFNRSQSRNSGRFCKLACDLNSFKDTLTRKPPVAGLRLLSGPIDGPLNF